MRYDAAACKQTIMHLRVAVGGAVNGHNRHMVARDVVMQVFIAHKHQFQATAVGLGYSAPLTQSGYCRHDERQH